jgi:hypothetical protein
VCKGVNTVNADGSLRHVRVKETVIIVNEQNDFGSQEEHDFEIPKQHQYPGEISISI